MPNQQFVSFFPLSFLRFVDTKIQLIGVRGFHLEGIKAFVSLREKGDSKSSRSVETWMREGRREGGVIRGRFVNVKSDKTLL